MTESNVGTSGSNGPNLWSSGIHQFGVYADSGFNLQAVHFSRVTRGMVGTPVDLGGVAGNVMQSPVNDDGHETPALCVDSLGHIWISRYDQQPATDAFTPRLIRSTNPLDITAWQDKSLQLPSDKSGANPQVLGMSLSYTYFASFSDGAILMTKGSRRHTPATEAGAEANGSKWLLYLAPGATSWANLGMVANGDPTTRNAWYSNCPYIDKNDRVHLFGTWREEHGEGFAALTVDGLDYIYSDDRCVTWKNILGQTITTPFTRLGSRVAGHDIRTGFEYHHAPYSAGDMANVYEPAATVDKNGHPVGTIFGQAGAVNPAGQSAVGLHVISWNGTAWVDDATIRLTFLGAGSTGLYHWKNDLWAMGRVGRFQQIRRQAAPHETINVFGPVAGVTGTAQFSSGRFPWADPIALRDTDTLEFLYTNNDIPVVCTVGDGYRVKH